MNSASMAASEKSQTSEMVRYNLPRDMDDPTQAGPSGYPLFICSSSEYLLRRTNTPGKSSPVHSARDEIHGELICCSDYKCSHVIHQEWRSIA